MAKSRRGKGRKAFSRMRPGHGLGAIRSVRSFRSIIDAQSGLSNAQRLRLIDQAEILLGDLYAHLLLKRAMHVIDPLQRLRLLKQRVKELSITLFQAELLEIFKSLRDLHTNYSLPAPFGNQIAFLGILVEHYFEGDEPKWMVSKVAEHLVANASLTPGVEITYWNGMPIELAVWRNADKEAGSNAAAQMARGLETLTLRFMRSSFPPDEDWVTITYLKNGVERETRLDWQVFDSGADLTAGAANPAGLIEDLTVPLRYQVGLDERGEHFRQVRKMIFNRAAVKESRRAARYKDRVPRATKALTEGNVLPTSRPDEITAKLVSTNSGTFGYLRLWTFHMADQDIDAFINEFIRFLVDEMPPEGLIIDVRGNGGGFIIAAEFLLQLLTPNRVTPEPTQFLATSGTLSLANSDSSLSDWRESLKQAVSTGALYSSGIPLSPEELINRIGQLYFGPVVLVTDAYCYSACDMFAAGFQDHNIGTVLGVDNRTGAGGANVLRHSDLLTDWTNGPLKPLPGGAGMRVSLRRTLRVGERAGEPIEDLGVTPDIKHNMTRNDLLQGNIDLLERAGEILAQGTPRVFDVELSSQPQTMTINITSLNVGSVDVYVNGRPVKKSTAISDGNNSIEITKPGSGANMRIEGYKGKKLVAARNINLT